MDSTTSLGSIPIVDFAPFLEGDAGDRRRTAQQIYRACHDVGFLYLHNHGIPADLIHQLMEQVQHFFALPIEAKQALARSPETNCGYVGLQQERLDPSQPGDIKEAFNAGLQAIWPSSLPNFEPTVMTFYRHCIQSVAPKILQAFAIALGLPEPYFDDKHRDNYFLRLLHYPPLHHPLEPGQRRAGTHTDYGSITLLLQDEVGGLEVQTRDGQWIKVDAIPGTILVNVGDAMQRWTNDTFCSTPHRVQPLHGEAGRRSRYSVALFCDPNPDVLIECLPGCCTSDRPPRYPPILTRDHLDAKLRATYEKG